MKSKLNLLETFLVMLSVGIASAFGLALVVRPYITASVTDDPVALRSVVSLASSSLLVLETLLGALFALSVIPVVVLCVWRLRKGQTDA